MYSAVLIIPSAHLSAINALGSGMGWGPSNYSVPLATDPEAEEATHYGARVDVDDQFIAMTESAKQGSLPVDVENKATVLTALDALITDFSSEFPTPKDHWSSVIKSQGLVRIG